MLTSGADHLLIAVGHHSRHGWGQWSAEAPAGSVVSNPEWHLGKIVRVAIETGNAEVLTVGHRNPQGFARDEEDNLWITEHGPPREATNSIWWNAAVTTDGLLLPTVSSTAATRLLRSTTKRWAGMTASDSRSSLGYPR